MALRVYLFGQFKLLANDTLLELPSRPAQSLLAFLALNAGMVQRREKLASLPPKQTPAATCAKPCGEFESLSKVLPSAGKIS